MESRAVQKRGHEDLHGVVEIDDSLGLGLYGKVLERAALHDAHSFRVPARRQREIDSVNAISQEIKDVPGRGQKKMGVIQRKGGFSLLQNQWYKISIPGLPKVQNDRGPRWKYAQPITAGC